MVPFGRLLDALSEVPDPRRAEGKRYPLAPLLLFTVLALLSGATSYRHIICFLEQRRIVLNALFGCHPEASAVAQHAAHCPADA